MKTSTNKFCLFNIIVFFSSSTFLIRCICLRYFLNISNSQIEWCQICILPSISKALHAFQTYFKIRTNTSSPWFFEAEYSFYYYHILWVRSSSMKMCPKNITNNMVEITILGKVSWSIHSTILSYILCKKGRKKTFCWCRLANKIYLKFLPKKNSRQYNNRGN